MTRSTLLGILTAGAVILSACTGAEPTAQPSPSPAAPSPADEPPVPPSPTPNDDEELTVLWTGAFELPLPNGWTVRDCDGDRTHVCVHDGDELLGDIELLAGYPLDTAQQEQEPAALLDELTEGFLAHFREDRTTGCPDFTFVADEVRPVTVGGQPGARAAFSLVDDDGRVVERVVNHFTVRGDTYAIVNTDAYVAEGGCLGPSEYDPSFSPDDLASLEEHLDRIVADSPLPRETSG